MPMLGVFCSSIGIQGQTPIAGSKAKPVILFLAQSIKWVLFKKQKITTEHNGVRCVLKSICKLRKNHET